MARVIFSPLISAMSGKTADAVFASWKGRAYVRQLVIPANPQTPAQTAVRDALAEAVAMWQALIAAIVTGYNDGADELSISGYNDFVGRNRAPIQALTGLFGPRRNLDAADPRISIPATFTCVGEPEAGYFRFQWTDPGQGAAYRFGGLLYDATDNVLEVQNVNFRALSDGVHDFGPCTIGNVYLCCGFVYRTTDEEMVHFGSGSHTQAS